MKGKALVCNCQTKKWLSRNEAADLIQMSIDIVERRGIPWQEEPLKYKIRYKVLKLDEGTRGLRRYFRADIEALIEIPTKPVGRARKLFAPPSD